MTDDARRPPTIGFGLPVSGAWATPSAMIEVAQHAEELGYAALWTFQRVLAPAYDDERNPGNRRADHPSYRSVHDPLLTLAHVASHTDRIGLGTATICAPFTPPALLAKSLVTLDHLAGGRLTVGLGIGWLPQEYAAAGVPFERRGARMEEYLRCLDALWTQDPVEFAGEFYTVPQSYVGPRPVQRPRPPVLLGGAARPALRRAGRLAEGWIVGTGHDLATVSASVDEVRAGAREAGRDPGAVRVLARVAPASPDPDRAVDEARARIRDLHERGVTEVFVDLNFAPIPDRPDAATAYVDRVLEACAPRRCPTGADGHRPQGTQGG